MAGAKQAYLITSPGICTRFFASTGLLSALFYVVSNSPEYNAVYKAAVDKVTFQLMYGAHKLQWWGILGLLSSACCAIQILLNVFNLGCAGFNTYLGPLRPYMMAVTTVLQGVSISIAAPRQYQWPQVAGSSALLLLMTFLPELTHLHTRLRRPRSVSVQDRASKDKCGSSRAPAPQGTPVSLQIQSMGCVSCVDKVTAVLHEDPRVTSCDVSLEDGYATVQLSSGGTGDDAVYAARALVERLEASGFPAALEEPAGGHAGVAAEGAVEGKAGTAGRVASDLMCVAGGLASSSCCLLQAGLNLLAAWDVVHVGCAGFNKLLGPVRAPLRLLTALGLAAMWRPRLRPSTSSAACCPSTRRLVVRTAVTVMLALLPEALLLAGGPGLAPPTANAHKLTLSIEGMGCEACQTHVSQTLSRMSGVVWSATSFESGLAEVLVADQWGFDLAQVAATLDNDGYTVTLSDGEPIAKFLESRIPAGVKGSGDEL